MLRVIIAGSRDFDDYALLQAHADYMLSRQEDIEIVSGGAIAKKNSHVVLISVSEVFITLQ